MKMEVLADGDLPAVFHQIEHDLVQHLLEQGGADPQVLNPLWDEGGQPGHLPQTVLALQALTPSACGQSRTSDLHQTLATCL